MLVSLSKWLLWWYIAFSQFPKCFSSPSLKVQRSQTSHWTSLWGQKTFFIVSKNRLLNFLFSLSVNCYLKIAVIFARVPNSFMASYISYLCLMDCVISQLVSKCSLSWHRSTIRHQRTETQHHQGNKPKQVMTAEKGRDKTLCHLFIGKVTSQTAEVSLSPFYPM